MLHPIMRMYYKYKLDAKGVVYMLHRVGSINPSGISYNENMKVTPEWLEELIIKYQKQGFVFLSLDDLYDNLTNNKNVKPFVVFTLDDGYLDNYTFAYPIFKKYGVPFCVYVATDFPDRKAFLWWYALEENLKDSPDINSKFIELRKQILSFPKEKLIDGFTKIVSPFVFNPTKYVSTEAMSWTQIEEMAEDPLCTIGGHTVSHPAFSALTEDEIKFEITEGVRRIESHINKKVYHFAYPYGSENEASEREYIITKQFGFKTIATTIGGVITSHTDKLCIPRYMLMDKNYIKI